MVLRSFCFLAFGFRILVKNTNGFSNLVSDVVLGFFLFPVPVSLVSLQSERQLCASTDLE